MGIRDESLSVLHVASFEGNLGDSAMHDGAYRTRAEDCPISFEYTPLEVREFFQWGKRHFDESFIEYLNTFDLAIFGGLIGYELWRDDTVSGMRFDIAPELLKKINVPVAFYGLGCDATRGAMKEGTAEKCRRFLDVAYDRNFLFSLRNDGSHQLLKDALGGTHVAPMAVIPDGALFARPTPAQSRALYPGNKLVAINLAGDMPDRRFASREGTLEDSFLQGIRDLSCELLSSDNDVRLVFVPHLYSDLTLISKLLEQIPDEYRRRNVSVAPYLSGVANWSEVFDIYRQADLVIGMRFHACVVAVGQGTPTIGIDTHHKVSGFFEGMGLSRNCISLDREGWYECLLLRALELMQEASAQREYMGSRLIANRTALKEHHESLFSWYSNWKNS